MKKYVYILILATLVMAGCGTKKKAVAPQQATVAEPEKPAWHTCIIPSSQATVRLGDNTYSASVTMQTVRDSMIVISVMPLLGIELARFEATPVELTGINKFDGTYATTTFADLNRSIVPAINWDILQQFCTGELPTGTDHAHVQYRLGGKMIEMTINYSPRQLDVPVRLKKQNVSRYRKLDITKWL